MNASLLRLRIGVRLQLSLGFMLAPVHARVLACRADSVEDLAQQVGMSRTYRSRVYRAEFGVGPGEALQKSRLQGGATDA